MGQQRRPSENLREIAERAVESLKSYLGPDRVRKVTFFADEVTVTIDRNDLKEALRFLKEKEQYEMLVDATAVDWLQRGEPRFEVVYHLLSLRRRSRLRLKATAPSHDPRVPCICDIYFNASPYEREIWDMFGIVIDGHPNLKRILTYEEFPGHPLRKDFPLFWQPGQPVTAEAEEREEW